jgi:hypothetical protein
MYEQPYWNEQLTTSEMLDHLVERGLSCEGPIRWGEMMSDWVYAEAVPRWKAYATRPRSLGATRTSGWSQPASRARGAAFGRGHDRVSRVRGLHPLRRGAASLGPAVGEGEYRLRRKTRAGQRQPGPVEGKAHVLRMVSTRR